MTRRRPRPHPRHPPPAPGRRARADEPALSALERRAPVREQHVEHGLPASHEQPFDADLPVRVVEAITAYPRELAAPASPRLLREPRIDELKLAGHECCAMNDGH